MHTTRKSYPSDVSDDWAFLLLYLTLMREDAPSLASFLRNLVTRVDFVLVGSTIG